MNEAGNEAGSVTVVLPETGGLIALRRKYGADTAIGHRASNILEMLDAGTARPADIARQVRELAELTK